MDLKESALAEVTLSALVRLLKNEGYDLEGIKAQYDNKILSNELSGSNPQYKLESMKYLEKVINEA